ncbi:MULTISPECIES: hypothetical protein [Rhizobium]|uniref:hypothetical protein n=1 Tax=Rhizobium TaxID=379 RepID=UPI001C834C34|nr:MULTISPECIES: hypothetical protein [Rhizobium]MBX4922113.1 hypothetical protein [Rhizobium bangladeshense]MBY3447234.1 hypothetical protein [Rhizobium laguerreae]
MQDAVDDRLAQMREPRKLAQLDLTECKMRSAVELSRFDAADFVSHYLSNVMAAFCEFFD